MSAVERFCDRAMLIERGGIVRIGPPREVSKLYSELNFGHTAAGAEPAGDGRSRGVVIHGAWCENEAGERIVSLAQDRACRACFAVEFERAVEDPWFAITFRNDVAPHDLRRDQLQASARGHVRGRRARDRALRVPQLARAGALHAHAVGLGGHPAGGAAPAWTT